MNEETKDNIIQPCPFCGSEDIETPQKFTGNYKHGKPTYITFNKCNLCGASSRAFSYTVGIDYEYEEAIVHAIEAWNRRSRAPLENEHLEQWEVVWNDERLSLTCSYCRSEFNFGGKITSWSPIRRCPGCLSQMSMDLIEVQGG